MNTLAAMPKYEAYKESGADWIGKIPTHWDLTRLATRFEERRTKVSDKDYPPLSVTKNGILPQLDSAAKTNDGENRKLVKAGDFVINSRSDRKGSSGISDRDGSVSLINIVLEPQDIHPQYCNYLLKSYNFIEEFYRMGHGIVADLWTTRYDEMKAVTMGLPTMPEQTAIANFLDRKTAQIDQAIAIKEKQITLLKERKQILIQNVVTRGLDPNVPMKDSGVEWLGVIPEHWGVLRLRFLGVTQNGISAGAEYFGSGYPFVSYGDVYNNRELPCSVKGLAQSTDADRRQYSILKGDVLFTRTSETIEEIGFASVCMHTIENAIFAGFLIRFRPKHNALFDGFTKYYFSSHMLRDYFVKEMNLVTRASLSQELLKDLPVLLPPKNEQEQIYTFLESELGKIDKVADFQQQQIDKLKEYKSTLINSAVTGKIRVPDINEHQMA